MPIPATAEPGARAHAQDRPFWTGLALVVLGAAAGVALTLSILALLTGSLDFVTRREFEALSRNVDTIQRNYELAVDRVEDQARRLDAVQDSVGEIDAVQRRLGPIEVALDQAETDLAGLRIVLDAKDKIFTRNFLLTTIFV